MSEKTEKIWSWVEYIGWGLLTFLILGLAVWQVLEQQKLALPEADPQEQEEVPVSEQMAELDLSLIEATELNLPEFDIVRIGPQGTGVIAGRYQPNTEILLYDGDIKLAEVTADKKGHWVWVIDPAFKAGSYKIRLAVIGTDQEPVFALKEVFVVVPEYEAQDFASGRADMSDVVTYLLDLEAQTVAEISGEGAVFKDDPTTIAIPQGGLEWIQTQVDKEERGGVLYLSGRVFDNAKYTAIPLSVDVLTLTSTNNLLLAGHGAKDLILELEYNGKIYAEARSQINGRWVLKTSDHLPNGRLKLDVVAKSVNGDIQDRHTLDVQIFAADQEAPHYMSSRRDGSHRYFLVRQN